jgi:hypothetical protein
MTNFAPSLDPPMTAAPSSAQYLMVVSCFRISPSSCHQHNTVESHISSDNRTDGDSVHRSRKSKRRKKVATAVGGGES